MRPDSRLMELEGFVLAWLHCRSRLGKQNGVPLHSDQNSALNRSTLRKISRHFPISSRSPTQLAVSVRLWRGGHSRRMECSSREDIKLRLLTARSIQLQKNYTRTYGRRKNDADATRLPEDNQIASRCSSRGMEKRLRRLLKGYGGMPTDARRRAARCGRAVQPR